MNLQFSSLQEFQEFITELGYTKGTGDGWKQVPATEDKKVKSIKTETKPVTQADIQASNKAATNGATQTTATETAGITLEDIRAVGAQLAQAGKTDTIKLVLKEFKCQKIGDLKETDFSAVHSKLSAFLN